MLPYLIDHPKLRVFIFFGTVGLLGIGLIWVNYTYEQLLREQEKIIQEPLSFVHQQSKIPEDSLLISSNKITPILPRPGSIVNSQVMLVQGYFPVVPNGNLVLKAVIPEDTVSPLGQKSFSIEEFFPSCRSFELPCPFSILFELDDLPELQKPLDFQLQLGVESLAGSCPIELKQRCKTINIPLTLALP